MNLLLLELRSGNVFFQKKYIGWLTFATLTTVATLTFVNANAPSHGFGEDILLSTKISLLTKLKEKVEYEDVQRLSVSILPENEAQFFAENFLATTNISILVTAGDDDAEEEVAGGIMDLTSSDLELVDEGGTNNQLVGMRFQSVSVPQGAKITNAYVQFSSDVATSGAITLIIHGQDISNAGTFLGTAGDISGRDTTASSVSWSPPDWTGGNLRGTDQQTSDISSIIQEVVDRGDWASGQDMVVMLSGPAVANWREAESYNGASGHSDLTRAPELFITYDDAISTYLYDNETSGTLTVQSDCNTQLTRTFTVSDNFTVDDLNVGLNLSHSYRGDLRVQLESPQGTIVELISQVSNEGDDNFDLMLDDESGNASVDDGTDNNLNSPIFGDDRTAQPDNALSAFDNENASGTWTLRICNTNFSASGGRVLTFNKARLFFEGTSSGTCSGNADSQTNTAVNNAANATGAADTNFAELYETNDQLVLDLTDTIVSGQDYTLRWRRGLSTSSDPTIVVEESEDNSSWTAATGSPFTFTTQSFFDETITASTNTRYLRLTTQSIYDVDFDAVTYTGVTCNPNAGGGGGGGGGISPGNLTCSPGANEISGNVFEMRITG